MLVQDGFALWVYRKDWNGRILAVLIPGAIVGIGLAWWLAADISTWRCACSSASRRLATFSTLDRPQVAHKTGNANAGAGVFLAQSPASRQRSARRARCLPDVRAVAEPADDDLRRHHAIFFATMNPFKVVPYFALGQFSMKGLATSLVLLPLGIVTNQIGFWVVRITPAAVFFRVTMIILFLISSS